MGENLLTLKEQVAGLEVHYLGNREGDLRFALLSDWGDSDSERTETDDDGDLPELEAGQCLELPAHHRLPADIDQALGRLLCQRQQPPALPGVENDDVGWGLL